MLRLKAILSFTLVWLCALMCEAHELYCNPAVEMPAGCTYTDSVPDQFISCDYHFRVELPDKAMMPEWGVRLIYGDGRLYELIMKRDGNSRHDVDFASPVDVRIVDGLSDTEVGCYRISDRIDLTLDAWSIRLVKRVEDDSLRCVIGQRDALLDFNMASDGLKVIEAFAVSPLRLSRLSLFADENAYGRQFGRFDSVAQLTEYLSESDDRSECVWRYLDRNTDQRRLNTGGDYRLASVRCDDGSYDILYLDGARVNAGRWQAMMVKGRLLPTAFANHYDLIWYDAFGREIKAEASADIIDGAILRLNLPLHGGSVRYQRDVRPAEHQNR